MTAEYFGLHGSCKGGVGDCGTERPCKTHGHLDYTVRNSQGGWVRGSLFRKDHTEAERTIKKRLKKFGVSNGWSDLRVSETQRSGK